MIENFAPGVIERLGPAMTRSKPSIRRSFMPRSKDRRGRPLPRLPLVRHDRSSGRRHGVDHRRTRRRPETGHHAWRHGQVCRWPSALLVRYQKRETEGQRLTVAMQDAMLQYARLAFSAPKTETPAARAKASTGGNAPMGLYPCKPGGSNDYVYIYVNRANNQWHWLLEVVGRSELIGDERPRRPATGLSARTRSTPC